MNNRKQKEVLKKINNFIVASLGEDEVRNMQFLTGTEGMKFSEYAHKDAPYISFDGSYVYSLLNYGEDGWKWQDMFMQFLKNMGFYYEQGHAWNMSIYEDD